MGLRAAWQVLFRVGLVGLWAFAAVPFIPVENSAYAQVSTSFSRIDVAGNRRIESDTVRTIANIPTGVPVSPARLNAGIQALFQSGLFQDVEFSPLSGRLLVTVVENPTINRIGFEGNRDIDDATLDSAIELRPRRAYNLAAAEADALRIVEAYRASGRFDAEVLPFIIEREDNRVDLVFQITEGRVTDIQRISFVGNDRFSDSRLRRAIETSEAGVLRIFFSNDTYDPARIELDRQLLREFYLERGHVDFEVRSIVTELSRDRKGFFVSFNIQEGPKFDFGNVTLSSTVPEVDATPYQNAARIRLGRTYAASEVEDVIADVSDQLFRDGVVFVDVVPRVTKRDADRKIDIDFEIVPSPRVFVERIDIEGNSRTLDRVIRRQFRIVEGDAVNPREIRRAEGRIRALGIFSNVVVSAREGSGPDQAIIDVDVEEDRTGTIGFGVGFSTEIGVNGAVTFSERNFLGRGQNLAAEVSVADRARIFSFSFTEPGLLDRDLLAGFDAFFREVDRDESSFQETRLAFQPRLTFPVSEDGRLTIGYRISNDEIRDVDSDASVLIIPVDDVTSAINFSYVLDKRNSPTDPTKGFRLRLTQEFAGLGGDVMFSKTSGSIRFFESLFDEDLILSAEFEGGYLAFDGISRITDRFFLGGDTLRGFEIGGTGPRDLGTVGNDALGGNAFAVGRFEATFPVGLPENLGVFGGVFYDIGSVWNLDDVAGTGGPVDDSFAVRSSVGVSLFWSTPIGPLRFNWAWPISSEDFDIEETFRITLDTRF